jgi:hypothetical protein
MKFRRKPQVVDAEQWFPGRQVDGVFFHDTHPGKHTHEFDGKTGNYCFNVGTKTQVIQPGDWIVMEESGARYPLQSQFFDATYEPDRPYGAGLVSCAD